MAGKLVVNTINTDTVGAVFTTQNAVTGIAKAWVNWNGVGTPAIRGSFNVSSVTTSATGVYTINFTTAMPDVNYSVVGSARFSGASDGQTAIIGPRRGVTAYNTGSVIVQTSIASTATLNEVDYGNIAIFSS